MQTTSSASAPTHAQKPSACSCCSAVLLARQANSKATLTSEHNQTQPSSGNIAAVCCLRQQAAVFNTHTPSKFARSPVLPAAYSLRALTPWQQHVQGKASQPLLWVPHACHLIRLQPLHGHTSTAQRYQAALAHAASTVTRLRLLAARCRRARPHHPTAKATPVSSRRRTNSANSRCSTSSSLRGGTHNSNTATTRRQQLGVEAIL